MFTVIPHSDKEHIAVLPGFIYAAEVLVKTTSGHKVLELYVRDSTGHIYAKNGAYFISLMIGGMTSNSKVTWSELSGIEELYDGSYLSHFKVVENKNNLE